MMGGMQEYQRKTKGPLDGKLKGQVWVVVDDDNVALVSTERMAKKYARSVGRSKVTMVEVDRESWRFRADEGED